MWANFFDRVVLCNLITDFGAMILTGIVIKITDDYIDRKSDSETSIWLGMLGKGVLPYTIIMVLVAGFLNFRLTVGFYLAAYLVGMFKEPDYVFPLGLKGYQEIVVGFILSVIMVGLKGMVFYILLMLLVQLFDDLQDYSNDKVKKQSNIYIHFGLIEGLVLFIILIIFNLTLNPFHTILVFLSTLLINKISILKFFRGRDQT